MTVLPISSALISQKTDKLSEKQKNELEHLKKACSDFESIFMHQMLKEMRKTVNQTGMIHGGQAEEIFSDMLDSERSKEMKVGLGDMLFNQLSQTIIKPNKPR